VWIGGKGKGEGEGEKERKRRVRKRRVHEKQKKERELDRGRGREDRVGWCEVSAFFFPLRRLLHGTGTRDRKKMWKLKRP
jgi:hypothetical protein